MSNVPLELRKQLFRSPSSNEDGNSALMFKLQMEHDLELSYQGLQKVGVGQFPLTPKATNLHRLHSKKTSFYETTMMTIIEEPECTDLHEKRMKQLRQKAKALAENDWQYPSIEKLIGLH